MTTPAELRSAVQRALDSNDLRAALADLRGLWAADPGPASAGFVLSRLPRLAELVRPVAYRVAVLRSFTIEPCVPLLRAVAGLHGMDLAVHVAPFGVHLQELADPKSATYAFEPACVVLALQLCEISPALDHAFADLSEAEVEAEIERVTGLFTQLVSALRAHSQASLVLWSLEQPRPAASGLLDAQLERGQANAVRRLNEHLRRLASSNAGVLLFDYDAVIARHGAERWWDRTRYASTRMPFSQSALPALADAWFGALVAASGRGCKVLVLDLDNTVWGGLAGEEGLKVRVDREHPGAAFLALQRAALDLSRRGVLLAVCSKNNHSDALDVIENHPGMLLRAQHLAALRINWEDKAANLRAIAAELNVGLDTLAFVDDNPVERRWIRMQLPEVTVIELPQDPYGFAAAVRACPMFERAGVTTEDKARSGYYAAERLRAELEAKAPSLEDYYRSLEMTLQPADPVAALARLSQLTQRTNQFNVTTIRRTEPELAALIDDPAYHVVGLGLVDRFGDNGIVALGILRLDTPAAEIDTLLMSCRVIGRTVETALLSLLAGAARRGQARSLRGRFAPTAKNAPARDLFSRHGFRCTAERADGVTEWELELSAAPELPPWFTIRGVDT